MTIFLNDVHGGDCKLKAVVEIRGDGILLSIDSRLVAVLENLECKPQLVVYADANRDEPTHMILLRKTPEPMNDVAVREPLSL